MFNPFGEFLPQYLQGFRQKGIQAFVKQSYKRGIIQIGENQKEAFLLTHYDNLANALQHFDALKHDTERKVYNISIENDFKELKELINNKEGIKVFTRLTISQVNQKAQKMLDKRLRAYIDFKTDFRPSSYTEVEFYIEVIFGEIYALLKYRSKEIKVKLEEIEKANYVL